MLNILLHIPHASLAVPDRFYEGLTIPRESFHRYNLEMSDIGIEELFRDIPGRRVVAPYSRLYCDVERFRDPAREPMAGFGEGVIYTHTYDGTLFHTHGEIYSREVMKYYDAYHRQLDDTVQKMLADGEQLLILDCHSFSDKMASHFFRPPFPDVCVGIEPDYSNEAITAGIIRRIQEMGHTVQVDHPYKGSIIPNAILSGKLKGNIVSVMLEINKRIYL